MDMSSHNMGSRTFQRGPEAGLQNEEVCGKVWMSKCKFSTNGRNLIIHLLPCPRHAPRIRISYRFGSKALRALGVNMRSHQRFGDPDALDAFQSGRSRLEDPWSSDKCVRCASRGSRSVHGAEVNCESCETRTAFFLSESHDETTTLWAQESRRIAKSAESVTDPSWVSYLYTPAKIQLLEKEWKQTR